jgi:hypothetical protein
VKREKEHELSSLRKEIHDGREKLHKRIEAWRRSQKYLMPKVADNVAQQPACQVELECLFLPSDFTSEEDRRAVNAASLGVEEGKLREGQAFDAIRAIQIAVKMIAAMYDKKRKQDRGQTANTRSSKLIRDAQHQRDFHMAIYALARRVMIKLGVLTDNGPHSSFPPLTLEDTFMKSRQCGRGLGDSRRTDGMLWRMHASLAVGDGKTASSSQVTSPPLDAGPSKRPRIQEDHRE